MAIVHMKKLRLMVVRRQKDELLRDLMLLGCVQISEPDALLADAESAAVLRQESGNVTEVRSELTRLTAALKLLDKYAPVKSRLLSSRPEVTEADFLDDGAYRQELDAVAQLEELEAAVRRYNGEEAKLRSNMEALRPWQTLDLPLDLGETVRTRISLGMLPAAVDLAETAKALADAAPESQLYEISSDKEQHYVLLICLKEELTEAITALRASGFTLANLNGAPGTAKQNIEDAQQQIADVTRRREQAETDIAAFAPHRDAFKLCIDRASVKLGRAEAEERLVGTESVVCMRGWLTALPFILPGLILVAVFVLYPLLFTIRIALSDYQIVQGNITFIGLENFKKVLSGGSRFWYAYRNNFLYALVTVPFILLGGMLFAYLINNLRRGQGVFRVGFYLPVITSWVIVSLVFQYMFNNSNRGLINYILVDVLHVLDDYVPWLLREWSGNAAIWLMGVWKNVGWAMLIYLAALQSIPKERYEAAELDGAGLWARFRYITMPSLRPTTFYVMVNMIIGSFNVFIQVMMLTGGNPNGKTSTLQYLLYDKAFNQFAFGEASAIGMISAVTIVILTVILNRTLKLNSTEQEG